jgi:hypothetical protein
MLLIKGGFRAQVKSCLISNFARVIREMSETEDENIKDFLQGLGMYTPALMLQIATNVDLDFDDFDEILNHPLAEQLLLTFEQAFEMVGAPAELTELMTANFNPKINETEMPDEILEQLRTAGALKIDDLTKLIDNIGDQIQVNFSLPEHCISGSVDIKTQGLRKAITLGRGFAATMINKELEGVLEDEGYG